MAAIPLSALLMGTAGAVSAVSAIRQGNQAAAVGNANAASLEQQAQATSRQAIAREEMQRKHARGVFGEQIAAGAESGGALDGSNLDLLRESMLSAELDALNIRYEGQARANDLSSQASIERWRGRQGRMGGYLSAAGALLTGSSYLASPTLPMTEKQVIHRGGL